MYPRISTRCLKPARHLPSSRPMLAKPKKRAVQTQSQCQHPDPHGPITWGSPQDCLQAASMFQSRCIRQNGHPVLFNQSHGHQKPGKISSPPKYQSDQNKGNMHLCIDVACCLRTLNYLTSLDVRRIDIPIFPSNS